MRLGWVIERKRERFDGELRQRNSEQTTAEIIVRRWSGRGMFSIELCSTKNSLSEWN